MRAVKVVDLPQCAVPRYNFAMSTVENNPISSEVVADLDAILAHLDSGTPINPELASRVRERSERAQEELRRKYGELDVAVGLIREIRDEE